MNTTKFTESKIASRLKVYRDEATGSQSASSLNVTGLIKPSSNDPDLQSDEEQEDSGAMAGNATNHTQTSGTEDHSHPSASGIVKVSPDRLANIERRLHSMEAQLNNNAMAMATIQTSLREIMISIKLIVPNAPRVITHNPTENFREFSHDLY